MLAEVLLVMAACVAAEVAYSVFESLWGMRSNTRSLPMTLRAEMSDYDRQMADRSRALIRECFCRDGNNVMNSVRQMSAEERLEAARDFSNRLAQLNGLNLEISFFMDNNIENCGSYCASSNTAAFNIVELMWKGDDEAFEARISNFIDTIVHEQRHAVQIRAIREKGFWQIDDKRRANWYNNLPPCYIKPETDVRGYRMQPVESDAFTYAEMVLRGVE